MYDPVWRPIPATGQNLAIGAAVVTSAAVGSQTRAVRLTALTGNCHVQFGNATTTAPTVANLQKETLIKSTDYSQVFSCNPGDTLYVVQDGTSTGTLQMQELTH